jgi:hypothetical protein
MSRWLPRSNVSDVDPSLAPVGPVERWQLRYSGQVMRVVRWVVWAAALWIVGGDIVDGVMSPWVLAAAVAAVAALWGWRLAFGRAPRSHRGREFEQMRYDAWVGRQVRIAGGDAQWQERMARDRERWERGQARRASIARTLRLRAG